MRTFVSGGARFVLGLRYLVRSTLQLSQLIEPKSVVFGPSQKRTSRGLDARILVKLTRRMENDDTHHLPPDVSEYIKAWDAHESRQMWQRVVDRGGDADVAQSALDQIPEVDAIEALAANAAAVNLLIGRRWYVMQAAREAGATWEAIGTALRITKQGAQDYYRRQIENQEKYAANFHDTDRVRAALDGNDVQ